MIHICKQKLLNEIRCQCERQSRVLVAIVGPPAAGKSSLAHILQQGLGKNCCVVPMDGFHLDNDTLINKGILQYKGSPHTFDSPSFVRLMTMIKHANTAVAYPTFDRKNDCVIPDGGRIPTRAKIVIAEGNYLLLNEGHWADLIPLWDISIYLDTPQPTLRHRLIERWLYYGLSHRDAVYRTEHNDLKNAVTVREKSAPADYVYGI